jgi:hypothetical protein
MHHPVLQFLALESFDESNFEAIHQIRKGQILVCYREHVRSKGWNAPQKLEVWVLLTFWGFLPTGLFILAKGD